MRWTPYRHDRVVRAILRYTLVIVSVALLASTAVPSAASAQSSSKAPRTGTIVDRGPDSRSGNWDWIGDWYTAGKTGYWRTSSARASATWYLGDVQGTFKFGRLLLGDDSHDGKVRWRIYEKRPGDSRYRLKKTFNAVSQEDREGWKSFRTRIQLDGRVKIVASRRSGTVAVDDVRLTQVDVLPQHVEMAKNMCKAGVVRALSATLVGVSSIAAAVAAKYIGVAAITKAAARSLVSDAKLITTYPAAYYSIERAKDIVLDEIEKLGVKIWNDAVDSYQSECSHYDARFPVPGIVRGYKVWANDIAETLRR